MCLARVNAALLLDFDCFRISLELSSTQLSFSFSPPLSFCLFLLLCFFPSSCRFSSVLNLFSATSCFPDNRTILFTFDALLPRSFDYKVFSNPLLSSNFSLYLNDENNSEQYNNSNNNSKNVSLSFLIVFYKAIFEKNYVILLRSEFSDDNR